MSKPLYYQSATELSELLEKGEIRSAELLEALVERKGAVEGRIQAFNSADDRGAIEAAKASDERRAAGKSLGPLDGIVVGLKDVIAVEGQPLTCSSQMLENFVSPYDATIVRKLKAAGAVLWGRFNLDEFAMGSTTEKSSFHPTKNPWNLERVPGGSSGGNAAAVAAGMTICSIGSDTGGSIRQPAAHCGVVGLKPTYGRVSRYGMAALGSSLEQMGPIVRSVEDAALILEVIAGADERDSTTSRREVADYRRQMGEKRSAWKLGVPTEVFGAELDGDVEKAFRNAIEFYRSEGAEIIERSLPNQKVAAAVYAVIVAAEASSNLARYDGVRYGRRTKEEVDAIELYERSRGEGFGKEAKRRILLGTHLLRQESYQDRFVRAQKVRRLFQGQIFEAFEKVDAILMPTAPTPAFELGLDGAQRGSELSDLYTVGANLGGIPAISVPNGFSSDRLPIGLQILGKPFEEGELLAIARSFEAAHPFKERHPEL